MTGRNTNGGRATGAPSPSLIEGQPFNPHGLFNAIWIPLGILRHPTLSDGAKLLYGRLCLFAGKSGDCLAGREKIAAEMGCHVATIGRQLDELVAAGLIRRVRRGPSKPAACEFLWNRILTDSLRESLDSAKVRHQHGADSAEMRHQEDPLIAQSCTSDSAEMRCVDGAKMRRPYKEEKIQYEKIQRKDSSSFEENASVAGSASPEPDRTDDDELSLEVLEPEPVKPEGSRWEPTPEEFEAARNCLALHKAGYGTREQAMNAFLAYKAEKTESPIVTSKPDAGITRKVAAHFHDADDFTAWITDLAGRYPGYKIKGWGFYATDAGNWQSRRPEVLAKRRAVEKADEEQRRRDEWEAAELRRVGELCQRKGWNPVSRSICTGCAGYGRNPETEAFCSCPAGDSLRHCHTCNNAGTITTWPEGADRKRTPPLESWCTCEHAERLKAEIGGDYCEQKNAEAWASLRLQEQSDRWHELYQTNKSILRAIPGFKEIEIGFVGADEEEREIYLNRFVEGVARCSASTAAFRTAAA